MIQYFIKPCSRFDSPKYKKKLNVYSLLSRLQTSSSTLWCVRDMNHSVTPVHVIFQRILLTFYIPDLPNTYCWQQCWFSVNLPSTLKELSKGIKRKQHILAISHSSIWSLCLRLTRLIQTLPVLNDYIEVKHQRSCHVKTVNPVACGYKTSLQKSKETQLSGNKVLRWGVTGLVLMSRHVNTILDCCFPAGITHRHG